MARTVHEGIIYEKVRILKKYSKQGQIHLIEANRFETMSKIYVKLVKNFKKKRKIHSLSLL